MVSFGLASTFQFLGLCHPSDHSATPGMGLTCCRWTLYVFCPPDFTSVFFNLASALASTLLEATA
jgi:hypothetical protein